ncbi:MAG: excisionase family DNA-binding protein [Acidimicrobiales bacterium]
MTTAEAAELLNVSQSFVLKKLDAGELPSTWPEPAKASPRRRPRLPRPDGRAGGSSSHGAHHGG